MTDRRLKITGRQSGKMEMVGADQVEVLIDGNGTCLIITTTHSSQDGMLSVARFCLEEIRGPIKIMDMRRRKK